MAAIRAPRHANPRVPEDVSILGCDVMPLAADHQPCRTTIRHPFEEWNAAAARILRERLSGCKEDGSELPVPSVLIIREDEARRHSKTQVIVDSATPIGAL